MIEEINDVIEEVCKKYGYDSEDKENNDSLKTVLLRATTAMLKDANQEDRNLFYQMLRHTPIVITEKLTMESYQKLKEQYIGDINPHIIEEEVELGEYGKGIADGAYESKPIIDENMQLKGKKSFIYMQKVDERIKDFLGTDINVPHLIHELGHAWHAEKDEYTMLDDKTLKDRIGTAEFIYSFSKGEDNKYVQKGEKVTGLMIEEAINTVREEQAMADYMGIPLEEMQQKYGPVLKRNNYQGYISGVMQYTLQKLNKEDFENWRLYGNSESKAKINDLMGRTKYWENREKDILSSSDSPRNYDRKRQLISRIEEDDVQNFLKKYENVYFPDISKMTPLDKIENVLEQAFNLKDKKYIMGFENYQDFLDLLSDEGYPLINQSAELRKKDELLNIIDDVKLSDFNSITEETKSVLLDSNNRETREEGEKGENEK